MGTYHLKAKEIKRDWHLVDAKGAILGRMASEVAKLLMAKHKPNYSPHMDMGDFVVVINAAHIEVTGRKEKQKVYYKHSGYPGGFKEISFQKMKKDHPERIIELAVKRMLPNNRLKDKRMARLKVFAGPSHKYEDKLKENVKNG